MGVAWNWRRRAGTWFPILQVGATHAENRFWDGDLQARSTSVFLDYSGPLQSHLYLAPHLNT